MAQLNFHGNNFQVSPPPRGFAYSTEVSDSIQNLAGIPAAFSENFAIHSCRKN